MKPFFAIILASVVLLMNVGLTMSSHYCGGELVSSAVSFGQSNESCGMETVFAVCEAPGQTNIQEETCCGNHFLEFQVEDEFEVTALEKRSVDLKFVAAFVIAYFQSYSFSDSKSLEYLAYATPLLSNDLQVMHQTFLI